MRGWSLATGLVLVMGTPTSPAHPLAPPDAASARAADTPGTIVQRQVEAYNRHDLDAFAASYAEDVELFDLSVSAAKPYLTGRAALRDEYAVVFTSYKPTATIVSRMAVGAFVTDHERVATPSGTLEAMAIYQVENGLIRRVWFAQ